MGGQVPVLGPIAAAFGNAVVGQAAVVSQTQGSLTDSSGGTDGGAIAAVAADLAQVKVDVAAILTSMKNAKQMAS